jgi:hypothetical protein
VKWEPFPATPALEARWQQLAAEKYASPAHAARR